MYMYISISLLDASSWPDFSHRICSIGQPENGQCIVNESPATALIGLMARTYGDPVNIKSIQFWHFVYMYAYIYIYVYSTQNSNVHIRENLEFLLKMFNSKQQKWFCFDLNTLSEFNCLKQYFGHFEQHDLFELIVCVQSIFMYCIK